MTMRLRDLAWSQFRGPLFSSALMLLACCGSPVISAQHVSDTAYQRMLEGLLDPHTPCIDVTELDTLRKVTLLDARAHQEYDVSHLQGARWVGYDNFDLSRVKDLPKDAAIVVYCSVGYRSGEITDRLRKAGFTRVRNLYGGLFEWVNTGHLVVDSRGTTDKVHDYDADWGQWLKRGTHVH
jgi:rhodanese-related sulfurtransferase